LWKQIPPPRESLARELESVAREADDIRRAKCEKD
jgi:hypothetical protein